MTSFQGSNTFGGTSTPKSSVSQEIPGFDSFVRNASPKPDTKREVVRPLNPQKQPAEAAVPPATSGDVNRR